MYDCLLVVYTLVIGYMIGEIKLQLSDNCENNNNSSTSILSDKKTKKINWKTEMTKQSS